MNKENKKLLSSINAYIKHGTDDIYSVIHQINFENIDTALEKISELNDLEIEKPTNNKKISKLFNVLNSFDKKHFMDKTSNNRLSNHRRFKKIRKNIEFMSDNIEASLQGAAISTLRKPVITETDNRLEMFCPAFGNHFDYDIKNDFLKVYSHSKLVILEGVEEEFKNLIKEKILPPLQKEKEEFKIKQQEVFIQIKPRLNEKNYTPHAHFEKMNSWSDKEFKDFMDKFTDKELDLFKNVLLECAREFERKSMVSDRMDAEFDNIATRHRRMLEKIESIVDNESLKNNENRKIKKTR